MSRPWCPGSRRAIPGHSRYHRASETVPCPECANKLPLRDGCIPNHRQRMCIAPNCGVTATVGDLCARHEREIVEGIDA